MKGRHPNFFLIGAPRSGTTSVVQYLSRFEEVFLPSIKEPFYFSPELYDSKIREQVPILTSEKDYLTLFDSVKDQRIITDASTSYLWTPQSAELIYAKAPSAKIIAIVRNPVDRVFSHYLHYVGRYGEQRLFHQFVEDGLKSDADAHDRHHIESGFYARNWKRYLDVFPERNLLLLEYTELKTNGNSFFSKISAHLELPYKEDESGVPAKNANHVMKAGVAKALYDLRYRLFKGRLPIPEAWKSSFRDRHLKVKPEERTMELLHNLYREDSVEFEQMTGIKFES